MTFTIAVVNQKGGVGKTTTAISVSYALSELGYKTLAVDSDPQANLSSGLGLVKNSYKKCIYNCLIEECETEEVIQKSSFANLDLLPSSIQLAGAEIELVGEISRENKLKKSLKRVSSSYDFILIDCPPQLGLLTVNALAASSHILIPLQCEYFALEGLAQLLNTVRMIQVDLNPSVSILGILLTMADHRTNLTTQIIQEVKQHFPQHVFQTVINRNVKLSEAPSHGLPIQQYDRKSTGAANYVEFTKELLECLPKKP